MVDPVKLIEGDCLIVMADMAANSVDAVVTDPPYGLGLMGKKWDHGVPGKEFWIEALRVAKPGAWLLAAGGQRTHHRLMVAIEDAGWEIKDVIMHMFGTGFPKNKSTLKPAYEPWILCRKPLSEKNLIANLGKWGTGALNIDGCRIEYVDAGDKAAATPQGKCTAANAGAVPNVEGVSCRAFERPEQKGRWPANVVHDGSDTVLALFPESRGQLADVSTHPGLKSKNVWGKMQRVKVNTERQGEASANSENKGTVGFKMKPGARRGDAGSAARFFYCTKSSRSERGAGNIHPTCKPVALMRYLCRLVTPPGGMVLDPFMGSGTTGIAALQEGFRFIGIEKNEAYMDIARNRIEK